MTLRQVFICLRPRTPYPPLTHCVHYVYIQYTYSHRERWTREKVRGATVHKAGWKIPTLLNVSPVYELTTCCKVILQAKFFRWHFALMSIKLISPCFLTLKQAQHAKACFTESGMASISMFYAACQDMQISVLWRSPFKYWVCYYLCISKQAFTEGRALPMHRYYKQLTHAKSDVRAGLPLNAYIHGTRLSKDDYAV